MGQMVSLELLIIVKVGGDDVQDSIVFFGGQVIFYDFWQVFDCFSKLESDLCILCFELDVGEYCQICIDFGWIKNGYVVINDICFFQELDLM